MKMLIALSLLISFLFSTSSHPVMMVALIGTQTLLVCITLMTNLQTSWFSFILFLVFMGGLMVLFIYISSLASNEKLYFKMWWNPLQTFLKASLLFLALVVMMNTQTIKTIQLNVKYMIYKIYSPEMFSLTIMTMIYLLLALIVIVNIMNLKEGPLRPMV